MAQVYRRDSREIKVAVGEQFIVELEANPSAGYEWEPRFDAGQLRLVSHDSLIANTVGGANVEQFAFEARVAGDTSLEFAYKRSWEQTPIEACAFRVTAR